MQGRSRYGFALAADKQRLKANEKERRALRLMLECRDAGYSLRDTADELNRNGFTSRAGQRWRFEYVRSALKTIERHPADLFGAKATDRCRTRPQHSLLDQPRPVLTSTHYQRAHADKFM